MHTYGRSSRSSFNPPLSAVKTKKKKKKASRLSRGKKASILEKREERKERGGVSMLHFPRYIDGGIRLPQLCELFSYCRHVESIHELSSHRRAT